MMIFIGYTYVTLMRMLTNFKAINTLYIICKFGQFSVQFRWSINHHRYTDDVYITDNNKNNIATLLVHGNNESHGFSKKKKASHVFYM